MFRHDARSVHINLVGEVCTFKSIHLGEHELIWVPKEGNKKNHGRNSEKVHPEASESLGKPVWESVQRTFP